MKTFITLSITFLAAFSAFGQSVTVSPSILSLESRGVGDVGIRGGGTSTSFYAQWDGATWEIRREDNGTITAGTNINVLVIKQ